MSWFDKKSWQLRRKIKDLQAELAVAEREGKYILEQGLFFAELQEMGDNTLMVLGTAQHLESEEEAVVRNFMGRNGFTVETIRLDKAKKGLAAVEVIPPEELTRCVARELKNAGYRLVDDSEQERPARPADKMLTLSSIIRSISALFASHVHQLVINTSLKMNMEGNRLLHWMPLVRDALAAKVEPEILAICRGPFVHAYNHYYGQLGQMENPNDLSCPGEDASQDTEIPDPFAQEATDGLPPAPSPVAPPSGEEAKAAREPRRRPDRTEADAAHTLARIYKGLIEAEPGRRADNAVQVLEEIARFFAAEDTCLLARPGRSGDFSLLAHCSSASEADADSFDDEGFLDDIITAGSPKILRGSDNGSRDSLAIALPLGLEGGPDAVLYLRQPGGFSEAQEEETLAQLKLLSRPFSEFPDLLIGANDEKPETTRLG